MDTSPNMEWFWPKNGNIETLCSINSANKLLLAECLCKLLMFTWIQTGDKWFCIYFCRNGFFSIWSPCTKETLLIRCMKSALLMNISNSDASCALLDLTHGTISAIIVKWKKDTHSHSAEACGIKKKHLSSIASLTTEFQTASGNNFHKNCASRALLNLSPCLHSCTRTSLRSLCSIPSVGTTGPWCISSPDRWIILLFLLVWWSNLGLADVLGPLS